MSPSAARHRAGFFARQPDAWNIRAFVHYRFEQLKKPTRSLERVIFGAWTRQLEKISNCSKCCSKPSRLRAAALLKAFRRTGSGSDQSTGRDVLQSLSERDPAVSVNVQSLVVSNSSVGNLVYSYEGDSSLTVVSGNDTTNPLPESAVEQQSSDADADEDSDEDTDEDTDGGHSALQRTYSSFIPERKWRLPSDSTVEDILHDAYQNDATPASIVPCLRNWVLDLSNPTMQALFDEKDWEAIVAEVKPLPQLDESYLQSMERFNGVTTTATLRKVLESTSYKDKDDDRHFDAEWAERVLRHFLVLYEQDTLKRTGCGEHWFDCNVWAFIIDSCCLSIPDVVVDRCDLNSRSYVMRKNLQRTDKSSRMKVGPRFDGILRDYPDRRHEFCAIESAPAQPSGPNSTKCLSDKAKLRKALRDMISRLDIDANDGRRVVDELQVVGISTVGLDLQASRMIYCKGYVCLFTVEKLLTIPNDVRLLRELLIFLGGFVRIKRAIARSVEVFKARLVTTDFQSLRHDISTNMDTSDTKVMLPPTADSS